MRTIMYRAFLGCALFASLLSTVSCANRTRYLTVRPPHALPTEGQALPLKVALVLPDAVRNATDQEEISCPFGTTTFVFQTGPGFEKGALQALSQAFTKVEVVKEKKPGHFDLFIEPAAPDIELQGHCNMFVTEKATLDAKATVTVRVTDRNDQPFLDGTFASSQHTEEKVLDVVGKALADLLQVMAQGLMTTPKLQIYAGVPPSQEPVAPAPPPAPVASVAPSLAVPPPAPPPAPVAAPPVVPLVPPSASAAAVAPQAGKMDAAIPAEAPKRAPVTIPKLEEAPQDPSRVIVTGAGFSVGFGYVVTAYHLVAGMSYATVYEQDRAIPASLVLRDRLSDLALLKVDEGSDGQTLPGLRLGDVTKVRIGERVWVCDLFAMGGGMEKAIWKEGRLRPLPGNGPADPRILSLALTTPLQHSGGPVLNEQGEAIGLMLAPADADRLFSNLAPFSSDTGIAIKIQYAKWLLSMLPESEFVLPASGTRSLPVSTMIENAKPQVVVIKAAAK